MTLPFRRRHHDDEGAHDRARSLASRELLEALTEGEASWLARHVEGCADCRRDRDGYRADHELLRSLRDRPPEPPRDLWARTSAALEREAGRHPRAAGGGPGRERRRSARPFGSARLPLGAAAGVLIVVVVLGTAIVDRRQLPTNTPAASTVAGVTERPGPTPISVAALPVSFIRATPDGSWELVISPVDEVCPRVEPSCRPNLDEGPGTQLNLGSRPSTVTISPGQDKLVVEDSGDAVRPGRIVVVPISSTGPIATTAPETVAPTLGPDETPSPEPQTAGPSSPAPASPEPTPATTPVGQLEIASGVTVVGDVAYSPDGQWLAFSAMPSDGATGPDLYLWRVGDPRAITVTTDHATHFSAWLDGQVLASRVEMTATPGEPAASGEPAVSAEPSAPVGTEGPSGEPVATKLPAGPTEAHPTSFLLDPATLTRTDLARSDLWLPVVDPTGRFVAYWSGTVRSDDGLAWELGTGELVLDGWSSSSPTDPDATGTPDAGAASSDPSATSAPGVGPSGAPTPIVPGTTGAFKAMFDPTGTRLAVWVGELASDEVGRLHLVVLDAETGAVDEDLNPLPGTPALPRFSIDRGRLAWVTLSGQDGNESAVQVLGWKGDDFGEIRTGSAQDLSIVR